MKVKSQKSKVKSKVCGITNLADALSAVKAGASALGFVFYKKSPRYIAPEIAKKITRNLPAKVKKIGVFVNAQEKFIQDTAKSCNLDMLQFHGNESSKFCDKFKGYKVIKAFRIKDKIDLAKIKSYKVYGILFDTFVAKKIGGTGKKFNWQLLKKRGNIKQQIFLSGGLNAQNVKEAIKIVQPDWVDASSSLEITPGKKDARKVKQFIAVINKFSSF